ncbi:hypothetical protein FA95DRAFT_1678017 [Auriscalpium vulgare]|uniref:Uncharacterized protein n=1 Tax=Auriscalpium vulgare TaxID=40419 RepID=A0ACB8RX08_9AGAM|nr:hypothetical protein FA95DRAFT_1678017 [Auriscalpium vulgare]
MKHGSHDRYSKIASLDAHIRDLTRQVLAAKLERNALILISTLPDEILSQIMLEYALDMDIFSNKWTGILFVCRRWYEVASSHSQLWSFLKVSPYSGSETRVRIRNSKEYPLTCIFEPLHNGLVANHILQQHRHRIRSLTINAENTEALEMAFKAADALPVLETLSVCYEGHDSYSLPAFIFGVGAPLLHIITLERINFSHWKRLSNLTELTLIQRHGSNHPLPTMDELLAVLDRSHGLRYLNIRAYLPTTTYTTISGAVALPCLERAELSGTPRSIEMFLRSVSFPATTSLAIKVFGATYTATMLSGLLVPIRLHLRKSGAPVLCSLGLSVIGDLANSSTITADTVSPTRLPRALWGNAPPQFELSFIPGFQDIARKVFTHILDALPLESATHVDLFLHFNRIFTPKTLCTVFQHIPRAEVVRVGVNDGMLMVVEGLMEAVRRGLQGRWGAKRRRAAKGIQWPTRLHLMASSDGRFEGVDEDQQVRCYDALEALLATYKTMDAPFKPAGVPWGTLEFTHIELGYNMVEKYKERLFPLVGTLMLRGEPWYPFSWRKSLMDAKKQMPELARDLPEDPDFDDAFGSDESEADAGGANGT